MIQILKYGNTNTFYIPGTKGGLLVDTDFAGTLQAFYRAIKQQNIRLGDISYVLATHYHPDHMGLIGQLTGQGVKLLLADVQKDSVHFSDALFDRAKLAYVPICEENAELISCAESRAFLAGLGIAGEIISTPSHSRDGISLILDEGICIAGDLEPADYIEAYEDSALLRADWEKIRSFGPRRVYYSHRPPQELA